MQSNDLWWTPNDFMMVLKSQLMSFMIVIEWLVIPISTFNFFIVKFIVWIHFLGLLCEKNIVIALGNKMIILDLVFVGWGVVYTFF